MAIVIGASPIEKLGTFWGMPSSMMRKFPFGMLGMNRPLLSSTETSTVTTFDSTWKLGPSRVVSAFFLLYTDGILGCSDCAGGVAESSAGFLRGLPTVWLPGLIGPSCPSRNTATTSAGMRSEERRV